MVGEIQRAAEQADGRLELAHAHLVQRCAGEVARGAIAIAGLVEVVGDALGVVLPVLVGGRDERLGRRRVQLAPRLGRDGVEDDLAVDRRGEAHLRRAGDAQEIAREEAGDDAGDLRDALLHQRREDVGEDRLAEDGRGLEHGALGRLEAADAPGDERAQRARHRGGARRGGRAPRRRGR